MDEGRVQLRAFDSEARLLHLLGHSWHAELVGHVRAWRYTSVYQEDFSIPGHKMPSSHTHLLQLLNAWGMDHDLTGCTLSPGY